MNKIQRYYIFLWDRNKHPKHGSTSWETRSNCPKSCPMVIDFGFSVLKMTVSSSPCPLSFMRVRVSARTCRTLVFPAKGSPTSMKLKEKKYYNAKSCFRHFLQDMLNAKSDIRAWRKWNWNSAYPCLTIIISYVWIIFCKKTCVGCTLWFLQHSSAVSRNSCQGHRKEKKLIIIYMITLIIAQVLELGEKRPDSQPPEGKCLGTNHWWFHWTAEYHGRETLAH